MLQNVNEIKAKAAPILKQAGILRSAIFGSYARGEATEKSDIDLIVEYPKGISLFDVADLKNRLSTTLGTPIDLVAYKNIKPRLKKYILSEQIPIL